MFTNIFRGCFSFGAQTQFEKSRLKATYARDTEEPSEEDLKVILNTLSGKDLETRPQVGFATLVSKLETSDSREKWNYLLKNLVIFDRCVESRFFLLDIKNLKLPSVDNFSLSANDGGYDVLVRQYFRVIKEKAQLYSFQNTSFNVEKKSKLRFFEKLDVQLLFEEIKNSQIMHERTFQFTDKSQKHQTKHLLVQYIFIYILSLYLNLYSTQYTAISVITNKLTSLKYEQTIYFEKLHNKFLELSNKTLSFINENNHIPGFNEIEKDQFYSTDQRVTNCIKEYQELLKKNRSSNTELYNKYKVVNLDQETFNQVIEISANKTPIVINEKHLSNIQEIDSTVQKTQQISKKLQFSNQIQQSSSNNLNQGSEVQISGIKAIDNNNITDFNANLNESESNNLLNSNNELQIKQCTSTYSQKKVQFTDDLESQQEQQPIQIGDKMVSSEIKQVSEKFSSQEQLNQNKSCTSLSSKKDQKIIIQDAEEQIEIGRESLELGYTTYIQKKGDNADKISRLIYDRITLVKDIAEEDANNFDQEFFYNFEETFSKQTQELLNNAKSSIYQQFPISQSQGFSKSPLKPVKQIFTLDPTARIKQEWENDGNQNPFLVNMIDELEEKNNIKTYEELHVNIDWEKEDTFNEQIFDNFQNIYTKSTIESEGLSIISNNNSTNINNEQKELNQENNTNVENEEQSKQINENQQQPKKSKKQKGGKRKGK